MGDDSAQGQPGFWFRMRGFIKYKVSKGKRGNREEQTSGRGDWGWLAEVASEVPIGNS